MAAASVSVIAMAALPVFSYNGRWVCIIIMAAGSVLSFMADGPVLPSVMAAWSNVLSLIMAA